MDEESLVRIAAFLATALSMGCWEIVAPRRLESARRKQRWVGNLGVVAIAAGLARLLLPVAPVGLAVFVHEESWGVLPHLGLGRLPEWICSVLLLDLAIYFQHRAFHASNLLWRLHRMHHADTFIDFTTGVRFHPLEILLSLLFKLAVILVLAPPPSAVLAFEVILNGAAMFNHGNVRLRPFWDALLRMILVTPDMHRVHHSTDAREMNRNFGFNCPWWDRLFGTYAAAPRLGHEHMHIGLSQFREAENQSLRQLLLLPFR